MARHRYPYRLAYAYDNGIAGRMVATDAETARARAYTLGPSVLARGIAGTYRVIAVAPDGTETTTETITTADILTDDILTGLAATD